MAIFFKFLTTSNHFHPLEVENCGCNSRLVLDEDDSSKIRLERVKVPHSRHVYYNYIAESDVLIIRSFSHPRV